MNEHDSGIGITLFVPSSSEQLILSKKDEITRMLNCDITIISQTEFPEIPYGDKPIEIKETYMSEAPWLR